MEYDTLVIDCSTVEPCLKYQLGFAFLEPMKYSNNSMYVKPRLRYVLYIEVAIKSQLDHGGWVVETCIQ